MSITTVLFDMDGTLTDTMRLQPYLIWRYLLPAAKRKTCSFKRVQELLAVIYYINNYTWFKWQTIPLLRRQFQVSYFRVILFTPFLILMYWWAIFSKKRYFPHLKEDLLALKKYLTIGLVTNGTVFEVNKKIGSLKKVFQVCVTGSDVHNKKPNPEMILKAVKKAGTDINNTLYVGDTLVDMIASVKAGCKFALVATGTFGSSVVRIGETKPDLVFESIHSLITWLLENIENISGVENDNAWL